MGSGEQNHAQLLRTLASKDLVEKVTERCKLDGVSKSRLIRRALKKYLDKPDSKLENLADLLNDKPLVYTAWGPWTWRAEERCDTEIEENGTTEIEKKVNFVRGVPGDFPDNGLLNTGIDIYENGDVVVAQFGSPHLLFRLDVDFIEKQGLDEIHKALREGFRESWC